MFGLKLVDKAKYEKDMTLLYKLAYHSRTLNNFIRRNVDAGFLKACSCSEHEIETMHKLRNDLSEFFAEPLHVFENNEWLLKQAIEGK